MTTAIVNALTALPHAEFLKVMARPPRGVTPADLNEAKALRVDNMLRAKRISKRQGGEEVSIRKTFVMGDVRAHLDGVQVMGRDGKVRTLSQGDIDKFFKRTPKVETIYTKAERAAQGSADLVAMIERYAREHGVSKSVAADRIILAPRVIDDERRPSLAAETHQLEKQLRETEDDLRNMRKRADGRTEAMVKLDALTDEVWRSAGGAGLTRAQVFVKVLETDIGRTLYEQDREERTGVSADLSKAARDVDKADHTLPKDTARRAHNGPGADNVVESANDVLNRIADAQMRSNPSLSRAQAINRAADTREFGEAHRREMVAKFAHA